MGLDASVMCTCYQLGKTTPCPFPHDYYIDADGVPAVRLGPYDDDEKSDRFDAWLATCCTHPFMDYASIYINNWNEYRAFVDVLGQVGWGHFPTLKAQLPEANHGITSANDAALALAELAYFKSQNGIAKSFLVNSESGEVVQSTSQTEDGFFPWDGRTGLRLGFDDLGFFIKDAWDLNRELFRAMKVEQIILASDELDRPDQYQFTDVDTGNQYVSLTPVRVFKRSEFGLTQDYPHLMHVETRTVNSDYFASIIDPLTQIFAVSVETGNPVRWS